VVDMPNYSFNGVYEVTGNKIRLRKTLTIKNNIIPVTEMKSWKEFLEQIREFNSYLLTVAKK
jgi:hypothetical protein